MGAPPPQAIGKIQTATGLVTVMDARGVVAQVNVGDSVCRHDTIETGADGAAGITFTDGTAFNLSNNARMVLNQFVCDGTSNSALFSLSKGAFAFIAGKVAKTGGLRIDTPFARIRGAAQDGGIGILTLAALAFSTLREIQAASRSDAFLDDGTITYKDSPHGTFEITTRDGRGIVADDPGETVVVDPTGTVTRIPNSSSRMAELQGAQHAALATLSLGMGQQGAAPGGSSTATFDIPLQLQPINLRGPESGAAAGIVTISTPQSSSGGFEVSQQKAPPPLLAPGAGVQPIIEIPHITGSTGLDTAPTTSFSFTSSTPSTLSVGLASITWSGGDTPPGGLSAVLGSALTTSITSGPGGGFVTATFSAADNNFDFLAAGETLTIVYNLTVTDGNGASSTQPVTVTITGTNDAPVLAAASGPQTVAEDLTTTGTLTFTDVDLTDHHTVSTSLASTTWSGVVTPPSGIGAVLAGALSAAVADSTGSGSGSITVTFGAANALDFLAAGQTLTITYNVTLTDNSGVSSTQPVTITVIGTNDAPVITSTAQAGAVTEHTNVDNSGNLNAGGTIAFTDVDLIDTHTVGFTAGGNNYLGTFTPTLTHDATGGSTGTVGWTFSVPDKAVEFLGAGQTLTQTYTVLVVDNNGGLAAQTVTITITGTNEVPVITSGVQTGSVPEIADGAAGENTAPHSLSGAVTFTDADLSDIETSSISNKQVVATLANGYTLSAAQQNALVNAFTIDAATHSTTDGTGLIGWHYNINDLALDFLGKNDQAVLTFTVQVADGNGGFATQDVKITVLGAEDVPTITAGSTTATGSFSERTGVTGSTALDTASGSIAFADVDLSDAHTVSQTAPTFSWSGGTLSASQIATLTSASTLTLTRTDSTGTGSGSVAWGYSAQDQTFDFLGAGQTLTITYQGTINDGNGGTAIQNVVVTVTGTADARVIAPGTTLILSGTTLTDPLIQNNGTILVQSNNQSTVLGSIITGTGPGGIIEIKNNSTLQIDGSVDSGQTVLFSVDPGGGANSKLILTDPLDFHGKISDFAGSDQIDLRNFVVILNDPTKRPQYFDNDGTNTGGTLKIIGTVNGIEAEIDLVFIDGDKTTANFSFPSDGSGGTSIFDPPTSTPKATVIPVVASSTLTATETAGSQTDVSLASAHDGTVAALGASVSDPDGSETTSVTINGSGAVAHTARIVSGPDSLMVNPGVAPELLHRGPGNLANHRTVEVSNPPDLVRTALSRDRGAVTTLEGQIAIASVMLALEFLTENFKLRS